MLKIAWLLIKRTFVGWHQDGASQLAAALAFYAVLSFAPLVVTVIAISGVVFGRAAVQGQLVSRMDEWIGLRGAEFVQTIVANASDSRSSILATILSLLAMLFGATRLFVELQTALNRIWGVQAKPGRGIKGVIRDRLLSFAMVLGFGFFVFVFLLVSTIITTVSVYLSELFALPAYLHVVQFVVSFAVITVIFAAIYKVLPDVRIVWKDVWIGAATTSLLFTLGRYLIGVYLALTGAGSTYGAAASLFVLLLWVYYSAQVFLLGAEFTEVYTEYYGSSLVPDSDAIRFKQEQSRH